MRPVAAKKPTPGCSASVMSSDSTKEWQENEKALLDSDKENAK